MTQFFSFLKKKKTLLKKNVSYTNIGDFCCVSNTTKQLILNFFYTNICRLMSLSTRLLTSSIFFFLEGGGGGKKEAGVLWMEYSHRLVGFLSLTNVDTSGNR